MKFHTLTAVYLITVKIVVSFPADERQADECARFNIVAGQCDNYLAGQRPPLLHISFDGFRADYLNRTGTNGEHLSKTLNILGRCGVQARSMIPVYPSVTFPNHYSMVTGLYPESHGIVANHFYDPDLQLNFSIFTPNSTFPWWWIGEPIWYTAKKQGKRTATYFWPGSDAKDKEREPTYWLPYNSSVPYPDRIKTILEWLNLPIETRPNYLNLYLDEPDLSGHYHGSDSVNVSDQIVNVDQQIETLLQGMEESGILGCVDVMIVSDHGMASTPEEPNVLFLKDYVPDLTNTARVYDGVLPTIRPNNDSQEEQDRIARSLECQDEHMRVYHKLDFPRRHHFFKSKRIPSILVDMSISWRAFVDTVEVLSGDHGWDNLYHKMQAIFLAQGPSFRRGTVDPFLNIELYNLMCIVIGIDPAPNNGTWGSLNHLLVSPPPDPTVRPIDPPQVLRYPPDQDTYNEHLNRHKCKLLTGDNDPLVDATLNLTESESNASISIHAPWGLPRSAQNEDHGIKILVNRNRVTGFDVDSGVPSWVTYTINSTRQTNNSLLWRLDVRLSSNHQSICQRYDNDSFADSVLVPLFPLMFTSELLESDAQIDTNVMEVSADFQTFWTHLHQLIARNVTDGPVNVIVGPHGDPLRPSLFAVISSCQSNTERLSDCLPEDLDIQSFILPTFTRYNRNCTDPSSFLATNVATVKDVESLTGLELFPAWNYRQKASVLLRTALASRLIVDPEPHSDEMQDQRVNG